MKPVEPTATSRSLLREYIETETESLLGTLRYYLARSGLGSEGYGWTAVELLNSVVVEALEHADRFRPEGQPRAWLLGIAANLIKRRQTELAKRNRREPLVGDMKASVENNPGEDELFDRLADLSQAGPEQTLSALEGASAILDRVSQQDRRVLHLAIVHGMNGNELARALDITPGAARVRLHRALNRLRKAWHTQGR